MNQLSNNRSSLERFAPWIVAGLMLVATAFSFVFFQGQSLRLDEAQSLWQTSHTPMKIVQIIAEDVHVPFYHLILHVWQIIFGSDVSMARFLSFLFFLMAMPMVYILGRLCYDAKTSLFATALFIISPFMNWYGNEIRMYSLFVLIVLINQYFFLRIYRFGRRGDWWGFVISAIFGMYTHYFFFLILLTNLLFYLYNRKDFGERSFQKFFYTYAGLFVCFLPWLLYVLHLGQTSNSTPMLLTPSTVDVFNTFSEFLFGFQTDHLNTILVSLWPLTILFVFLALRKNTKISPQTFYLLFAFLLPNVVAFIVSLAIRPVYLTRYLIFTTASMYFIISWLISTYPRRLAVVVRGGLIVVMGSLLFIEAVSATTPIKENYREATKYLSENARSTDIVVVSAPFTIYPVLYYYDSPAALATLPVWDMNKHGPIPPFSDDELQKDTKALVSDHDYLWLLQSYDQGYADKIRLYFDTHYERVYMRQFSDGLTLYEYKLRYDQDYRGLKQTVE
jgi:mannosyltransferase